jgi:hypothetical protein
MNHIQIDTKRMEMAMERTTANRRVPMPVR